MGQATLLKKLRYYWFYHEMRWISFFNFALHRPLKIFQQQLLEEQNRWILWLPIMLSLGIVGYFQLYNEPPLWCGILACIVLTIALIQGRYHFWAPLILKSSLLMALGFTSAQLKTFMLSTFMLTSSMATAQVEGTLIKIEEMTGRTRLTLQHVHIKDHKLSDSLNLIRISCRGRLGVEAGKLSPGQRITMRAKLLPPNEPVAPGTYDFRRKAYFEGISAVGYAMTPPQIIAQAENYTFFTYWPIYLANFRHKITEQLRQKIGGVEGAIAASLITGDRSGIDETIRQAFADSGLAHILAISGLHLSIAAGLAFFFVRKGLSFFPFITLHYPIKKWAALMAFLFTGSYLFISGLTIPAQRAFTMTSMVLLGVLTDRSVLTLRNVALTAALILLISPEALMTPSFQMSFAAVTALVAGYEILHQPLIKWRSENDSRFKIFIFYLLGISLSTILATVATTPYIIYTFNRLTLHAIPANLIAIPLLSFVVMPLLVLCLGLSGSGLDIFIGYILKLAIGLMIKIALMICEWPGSVLLIPSLSPLALGCCTMGALWIIVWTHQWRWKGLLGIGLCFALMIFERPADIYINAEKKLIAIYHKGAGLQGKDLIVNSLRSGRFARETWMKRTASTDCIKLKDFLKHQVQAQNKNSRFIDLEAEGYLINFPESAILLEEDELLFYQDWRCRLVHQTTQETLTFPDSHGQDQGGQLLWITSQGFKKLTTDDWIGRRPWSLRYIK